jgi:hypothetical protein
MSDWQYGRMRAAWAFRINDRLIVRVDGTQPTACYDVRLREYVPDLESTADVQLGLYWRPLPGFCPGEAAPYTARIDLDVGGMALDLVRVDHADGHTDVKVQRVPFPQPVEEPGAETYTGWSSTSFEEAYRNAVALIPRRSADDLVHARIAAQGGVHGGLAGLDDVFVTVQRVDVSPGAAMGNADREALRTGVKAVPG